MIPRHLVQKHSFAANNDTKKNTRRWMPAVIYSSIDCSLFGRQQCQEAQRADTSICVDTSTIHTELILPLQKNINFQSLPLMPRQTKSTSHFRPVSLYSYITPAFYQIVSTLLLRIADKMESPDWNSSQGFVKSLVLFIIPFVQLLLHPLLFLHAQRKLGLPHSPFACVFHSIVLNLLLLYCSTLSLYP